MDIAAIGMAVLTGVIGIVVRLVWNRKVGRHLRARFHRNWLFNRGVVVGSTNVRRATPSAFEVWKVEDVDGGDVLMSTKNGDQKVWTWMPIRVFKDGGIQIVSHEEPGA